MVAAYDTKVVESGNIVEVFQYLHPIRYGHKLVVDNEKNKIRKRENNTKTINDNLRRSVGRTKQNLRNLINCNFDNNTSFLTLTFAENIKDVDQANYEFKKFKQKLERIYNKNDKLLKYVTVIEFQDGKTYIDKFGNVCKGTGRGVVHYHLLLFDAPYIDWKEISNKWANGFICINKCDDIDNMGAYLSKYMTKDNDDSRLSGKKRYFASYKTLKKPRIYKLDINFDITSIYNSDHIVTQYTKHISNDSYENVVEYTQFNLKRQNNIFFHINREDLSRKVFV